jgi:hypothetical protein
MTILAKTVRRKGVGPARVSPDARFGVCVRLTFKHSSENLAPGARPTPHPGVPFGSLSLKGRGEQEKDDEAHPREKSRSRESHSPLSPRGRGAGGNGTNFVLMKKGPF